MPKHQRSPIELEADQETGGLENAKRSPALTRSPAPRSAASAPAKLILCGEHAVVYSRPAIALPLAGIRASVEVADRRRGSGIIVHARDLRRRWRVTNEPNNPLSELITNLLAYLETHPLTHSSAHPLTHSPDLRIAITSAIPIAGGMGSGAAVATALVRALAAHLGHALPPAEISALVYASEQRYHGTPSGIDNTVIAYEQPIWFQRTKDERRKAKDEGIASDERSSFVLDPPPLIEPATIAMPFTLLIADTGVRSATRLPVGEVRQRWQAAPVRYEALFSQIGDLVVRVRVALAKGDILALGPLLSQNHALLQQIGVSSPELDVLVAAAQASGALGAKLSGAGWGGVMLALVTPAAREPVAQALAVAGAKRVIETAVLQHSAEHNSI